MGVRFDRFRSVDCGGGVLSIDLVWSSGFPSRPWVLIGFFSTVSVRSDFPLGGGFSSIGSFGWRVQFHGFSSGKISGVGGVGSIGSVGVPHVRPKVPFKAA